MKRCAQCGRGYGDDSLRFCLEDGTPLSAATDRIEPPATLILPRQTVSGENFSVETLLSHPTGAAGLAETNKSRRSHPILIGGGIAFALLLIALVAIAGYFVFKQVGGDETAKTDVDQSGVSEKKNSRPATGDDDSPTPDASETPSTPLKITATASSVRLAVQSNTYYPANAIDGKRTSAWIEGQEDEGLGEWIRFDFDREINLHRILFQPGYFKSPQIWAQNNRFATVTAQFSDGSSRDLNFADRFESQKIDVGRVKTRWVRLVIKSVYYGTDPDTALSEVAFEWDQ